MPTQLTAAQNAVIARADALLETAFQSGCEYPNGTNVVPALEGYASLASIEGFDYRPQAKAAFKAAMTALMLSAEDWHLVGNPGEPSFISPWVNYGGGYNPAGFYIDAFGRVHLRGRIKPSVGTATGQIYTLPPGYRPAYTATTMVPDVNGVHVLEISSAGVLTLTGNVNTWISLDLLSFRAA